MSEERQETLSPPGQGSPAPPRVRDFSDPEPSPNEGSLELERSGVPPHDIVIALRRPGPMDPGQKLDVLSSKPPLEAGSGRKAK